METKATMGSDLHRHRAEILSWLVNVWPFSNCAKMAGVVLDSTGHMHEQPRPLTRRNPHPLHPYHQKLWPLGHTRPECSPLPGPVLGTGVTLLPSPQLINPAAGIRNTPRTLPMMSGDTELGEGSFVQPNCFSDFSPTLLEK